MSNPNFNPASSADIEHRFSYHPPMDNAKVYQHEHIRDSTKELADKFDKTLPNGREKSLAITKLEEAMFWANAAIARDSNDL